MYLCDIVRLPYLRNALDWNSRSTDKGKFHSSFCTFYYTTKRYQIQVKRPMKTKTAYFKRNYNIARALVLSNHGQKSWTNSFFAITAEIHACSLGNFYGQYADRHMNLKFMAHVSERERAIRQSIIVKNKFMWVFNVSILLLTMNFVIKLSK